MRVMIILITPTRAENTGAAVWAMETMGFSEPRIVDSQAHLEPVARWAAHGSGDIIDSIRVFKTLVGSLHDVDFIVATATCNRTEYHYYATPVELVPLLEEKSSWVSHVALVFSREDSGLTNEESTLTDVLTSVPMVVDYPSLNLGQAVTVYYHQLATLIQQPAKSDTAADQHQLQALCERAMTLLTTPTVADDIRLIGWLQQRLGLLE